MPQDYKDASFSNNTGLNGQVTPTFYSEAGVLTTVTSPQYIGAPGAAQLTTQVNPFPGSVSSQSVVAEQQVAVTGPIYASPGGFRSYGLTTQGYGMIVTGGGP